MKITKFECVEVKCCVECPYLCEIMSETEYYCSIDLEPKDDILHAPTECPYNKEMDKEVWHEIIGVLINR